MNRLIPVLLASLATLWSIGCASAQSSGNPLLGQWELNGEDGWIRGQGKIRCDIVGLYFGPASVASATGTLQAPVFGQPLAVSYGASGQTISVRAGFMGSTVAYVFTSRDEMGVDNATGCKYRRVGSNAPTLAEHEAQQAAQAAQAVQNGDATPAQAAQAPPPPLPKITSYDDAIRAIDEISK